MAFRDLFKKLGNILYYPGCLSKFVLGSEVENYKFILNKIGIDFVMLPESDFLCCGSPARNAGYDKDARKLARNNFENFKKLSVKKIITNCPACFKNFKEYKELMPDWNIEVEHISVTILNKLMKNPGLIKNKQTGRITYHDPCHLGRYSGIYEEPRIVLRMLGFDVVEMKNNKENALCCGGGGGLRTTNPKLAEKIAEKRIKQAKEVKSEAIVTTCPLCFKHMEENNFKFKIKEFSQVLTDAFGIKREEEK